MLGTEATYADLHSWALTSIVDADLVAMKGILCGAKVPNNSLVMIPANFLVWEVVDAACHGLRMSFLFDIGEEAVEAAKAWVAGLDANSEAAQTVQMICASQVPEAQA